MFITCVAKLPTINVLLQEILSPGQSASTEYGWNLILVNDDYKVPKDWDIELTELSNGQSVDSRIYPDLQQMFDDMRAQGVYPVVASGYRTAEKQQELMDEKIDELKEQGYSNSEAKTEARRWVSVVGYSEHQTGLAVDINADGVNSTEIRYTNGSRKMPGNMALFYGILRTKKMLQVQPMSLGITVM